MTALELDSGSQPSVFFIAEATLSLVVTVAPGPWGASSGVVGATTWAALAQAELRAAGELKERRPLGSVARLAPLPDLPQARHHVTDPAGGKAGR